MDCIELLMEGVKLIKELLPYLVPALITGGFLVIQTCLNNCSRQKENASNNASRLKEIELNVDKTHQSQLMTASISSNQETCQVISELLAEANKLVSIWGEPKSEERQKQLDKLYEKFLAVEVVLNKNNLFIKPDIYQNIQALLKKANMAATKFAFGVMSGDTEMQRLEGYNWGEILDAVNSLSGDMEKIRKEIRKSVGFKDD